MFSRPSLNIGKPWPIVSAKDNPKKWEVTYEIRLGHFPIVDAQLAGRNPAIGAVEYFDKELDEFLKERWPSYLIMEGWVSGEHEWNTNLEKLHVVQNILWISQSKFPVDQRTTEVGYRREFITKENRDALNQRRPNSFESFRGTETGEPIGPGLAYLVDGADQSLPDELVWSDVLRFPGRTNYSQDRTKVQAAIERRLHQFNSHSELRDSYRHLANSDHKAAVRSAASAVETAVRFCKEEKGVQLSKLENKKSFDEKIEVILHYALLPSFKGLEPQHTQAIRYLYRARNSMHWGECSYKDDDGKLNTIRHSDQVAGWVNSARTFVLWLDSML